jgi:hypothetical protein
MSGPDEFDARHIAHMRQISFGRRATHVQKRGTFKLTVPFTRIARWLAEQAARPHAQAKCSQICIPSM